MPHLFSNRPRLYDLTRGQSDSKAQFRWETINAILYKIGGLVFVVGSVLFFPRFDAYANWGAWAFFFGSLLYLIVTGHDTAEAIRYRLTLARPTRASRLELVAAGAYRHQEATFCSDFIVAPSERHRHGPHQRPACSTSTDSNTLAPASVSSGGGSVWWLRGRRRWT